MEIINQPVSFYQQYTYQIWLLALWLTLFVILVLGLCISLLLFPYKRLKDELLGKSEKGLARKTGQEGINRLKGATCRPI